MLFGSIAMAASKVCFSPPNSRLCPANDYLPAGFKKTLVHTLQNIPDFAVKDGHVVYKDLEVPDIAATMGSTCVPAIRDAVFADAGHRGPS